MAYLKDEIRAGIIILSSFIILSLFVILIGGSHIFEKFDIYYTRVMNAAGLEEGAQVKLGGVRVGRVLNISAPDSPAEPITIKIGIKKGTVLYKGTKALVTQIGFVGDIYLLLAIENTTGGRLKAGDIIPSEEQAQFSALIEKAKALSHSLDTLINDVDRLFSSKNIKRIEDLVENTNKAIVSGSSSFNQMASSLKITTDKLGLVLGELEGLVKGNKDEFSALIKKAREDLESAGSMIKALEETAKSVDKTSRSIDRTIDIQSQNIDTLFNTLTRTTEDLQDLLQEIKNKPWSIVYKEGKEK